MNNNNNEITKKIEALIEVENNPVERSRLMLLMQMSALLADINNVHIEILGRLEETETKISDHILQNRRIEDRFLGAKKALAAIFVVAQGGIGYIGYQLIDAPKQQQTAIIDIDKRLSVLETKVGVK